MAVSTAAHIMQMDGQNEKEGLILTIADRIRFNTHASFIILLNRVAMSEPSGLKC